MLGIDVSKATLVVTLLCPQTKKTLLQDEVPNTQDGIALLLAKVPKEHPFVLEPTGRYSLLAATLAQQAGRQVLLASPRKAQLFLKSIQSRAKTDLLDSRGLALFGLSHPLPAYPVKSEKTQQLEQLLRARRGLSQSITRLSLQQRELPFAASALLPALKALKAQRKALDSHIALLVGEKDAFPLAGKLRAVPGIGPVVAATVAATLTERSFAGPEQFVAFIGLDVRVRQSGKRANTLGLSHQGDAELRRLFYLAAQANVRVKTSPFRALYERHVQKGRSRTAALCIVARKLAVLCWSMDKHGSAYDPARVTQQTP
jgi:transposase